MCKQCHPIKPARPVDTMNEISAFVARHGFKVQLDRVTRVVSILIPYTASNGQQGAMWHDVRTMQEARVAMGY